MALHNTYVLTPLFWGVFCCYDRRMNENLRTELLSRFEKQQEMVRKVNEANDSSLWDYELGKADTHYLKGVVQDNGWPTISMVGKDGAQAAWQLLQHADDDLDFQVSCLELMKALPEGEVMPSNIAYMEDRVRKGQGRPQLYGTQYTMSDAHITATPVEDIDNLDKRRLAMGLGPFNDEQEQFKNMESGLA
jgi:hypothetical protein